MRLFINSEIENINEPTISVADLLRIKNISSAGTAVAVNGALVTRGKWETVTLNDGDKINIISAAYGG